MNKMTRLIVLFLFILFFANCKKEKPQGDEANFYCDGEGVLDFFTTNYLL